MYSTLSLSNPNTLINTPNDFLLSQIKIDNDFPELIKQDLFGQESR